MEATKTFNTNAQFIDWPPFLELDTSMLVAEKYQRPADETRVRQIREDFRPELFGAITVATIEYDVYGVIDGQHRWRVSQLLNLETVWAQVHEDLNYQQRAMMFVDLQRRRKNLTPVERFRAEVEAGVTDAIRINEMLIEFDVDLSDVPWRPSTPNKMRAIVGLERIYAKDPQAVRRTLKTVMGFPSVAKDRTSNYIVRGVGAFLLDHKEVEPYDLLEKLSEADIGPSQLIEAAKAVSSVGGGDAMTRGVAAALQGVWMRG